MLASRVMGQNILLVRAGGHDDRMTRRRRKTRKHILFWSFPIFVAVVLLCFVWFGGNFAFEKAKPILDKVLSMVTIV